MYFFVFGDLLFAQRSKVHFLKYTVSLFGVYFYRHVFAHICAV